MYEEVGHQAPSWVMRELERVDDRYRQLMDEMKAEGGPINKVMRDMASDPKNRWDHTRALAPPQEKQDARKSDNVEDSVNEGRTELESGER